MNKITTFWIGHSSSLGNNTFKLKHSSQQRTQQSKETTGRIYIPALYLYDKGLTSRKQRELKQLNTKWRKWFNQ